MEFLLFQLRAPLAAWGEVAVGEYRPSANYPSQSALSGLLAAALGIWRSDEESLSRLASGYGFAIGLQNQGQLLRDYHTAQVASQSLLKKAPHSIRYDELNFPRQALSTILSTRDYRQNFSCVVAVQALANAPYALADLAQALSTPTFTLYLGRKSCPPSAPLLPQVMTADDVLTALNQYYADLEQKHSAYRQALDLRWPDSQDQLNAPSKIQALYWSNGVESGIRPNLTLQRKDRIVRRQPWQFADRHEYMAWLNPEDSPRPTEEMACTSA